MINHFKRLYFQTIQMLNGPVSGGTPYPGIDPSLLRDRLVNGFRMAAPNGTPDFVYSVMLQCWEFKSADRPSFTNIRAFIQNHIQDYSPFVEFTVSPSSC